ncbi:MAG TPA: hypothetical protein VF065_15420, partial [Ilumatobacter sp.]
MWDQTRHVAAWIPLSKVELGEIYEVKKGVPQLVGTLADWDIEWQEDPESEQRGNWTAKSERGVDITTKFEGSTPDGIVLKNLAVADAGAVVKFTEKDSYVISLSDVTMQRMENTRKLGPQLRKQFFKLFDSWDTGWLVVTEVLRAQSGTFLMSSSGSSQVELKANASVAPGGVTLADLATGFSRVGDSSGSDDFVGKGQISPMFKAVKLKIGGIGPGGVRSFDVDPEQLPEEERTVEAEQLADDDRFLDDDDADDDE